MTEITGSRRDRRILYASLSVVLWSVATLLGVFPVASGGHGCGLPVAVAFDPGTSGECREKALTRVAWMSLFAMHAVPFGVAYVAACARDGNAGA